jgi:hypothetical protein
MNDDLPNTAIESNPIIARVAPDKNLKVVITSDKGDYEFQIYTERAAKDATQTELRRTYALTELTSGAKMVENWGRLDEPAMIRIFSNLLSFSAYSITKVVSDWIVTCPECGHIEKGKHYEPQPRACKSQKSHGCTLRTSAAFLGKAEITEVEERVG